MCGRRIHTGAHRHFAGHDPPLQGGSYHLTTTFKLYIANKFDSHEISITVSVNTLKYFSY